MTPKDQLLPRRVDLCGAIHAVFWLSFLMDQEGRRRAESEEPDGWMINGLPANVRLQRYLARALASPQHDFSSHLAEPSDPRFFPS